MQIGKKCFLNNSLKASSDTCSLQEILMQPTMPPKEKKWMNIMYILPELQEWDRNKGSLLPRGRKKGRPPYGSTGRLAEKRRTHNH